MKPPPLSSLRPLVSVLLAAGLATAAALPAGAAEYSLFDLGSLGGNYARTFATGLNASGQVVGYGYQNDPWNSGQSGTVDYQAFVTGAGGQGITGLGTLAGDTWSQARAINDAGQVVGNSGNAAFVTSGFSASLSSPTLQNVGSLGGSTSTADAINASGQIAGTARDAAGINRAYLTAANGGAKTVLDTAPVGAQPPNFIAVGGVNDAGQVAGSLGDGSITNRRGFATGPGGAALHMLGGPDVAPGHEGYSPQVQVNAINAGGQTAGHYNETGGNAFLKNPDGSDLPLDFSAAPHYAPGNMGGFGQYGPKTSTLAFDVNSLGQVAGTLVRNDMPSVRYAFITGADGSGLVEVDSLSFVNLTAPRDFTFLSATGINDAGDFVVNANNGHAYLITQVPEPATVALMLAGLGVVGIAGRRRREGHTGLPSVPAMG
jgi:uncharacterized membrane protein